MGTLLSHFHLQRLDQVAADNTRLQLQKPTTSQRPTTTWREWAHGPIPLPAAQQVRFWRPSPPRRLVSAWLLTHPLDALHWVLRSRLTYSCQTARAMTAQVPWSECGRTLLPGHPCRLALGGTTTLTRGVGRGFGGRCDVTSLTTRLAITRSGVWATWTQRGRTRKLRTCPWCKRVVVMEVRQIRMTAGSLAFDPLLCWKPHLVRRVAALSLLRRAANQLPQKSR